MYSALLHTHSGLRYTILVVLVLAIFKGISGWQQKTNYTKFDNQLALFSMIFIHLQLVVGLILYFVSPKVILTDMATTMSNPIMRYYTVEHILLMLIVVALVTVGRIASKKKTVDYLKHKTIAIYYGLALLLILVTVYSLKPV